MFVLEPPLKKAPIQQDYSKFSTSEKRKLFVDDFLKLGKSSSIKDLEKVLSESRKNLPSNENESDKLLKIFLNGPPDRNVDTNEIIKSQPTVLPDLASMNISDELK